MNINYESLPEGLQGGMKRYVEQGIKPGSFMTAVLENDLFGALAQADEMNRDRLYDICKWLYNEAPSQCWGSKEKVEAWIAKGGAGK